MTNSDWKLPKLPPLVLALAPFLDVGTWTAVVYLWLGFPLGLLWFVGMVVGFAAGIPLTILWIGFAILAATLAGVWLAEGLERQLAIRLLGAAVPERLAATRPDGKPARLRDVLASPALWKGMLFLALRFPLGLACWVFSIVSLVVSFVFAFAPWVEMSGWEDLDFVLDVSPVFWDIDTTLELWLLSLAGIVLFVVTLHAHRALGWMWARLAEWLLGAAVPAASAPEPTPRWGSPLGDLGELRDSNPA